MATKRNSSKSGSAGVSLLGKPRGVVQPRVQSSIRASGWFRSPSGLVRGSEAALSKHERLSPGVVRACLHHYGPQFRVLIIPPFPRFLSVRSEVVGADRYENRLGNP